MAQRDPAHRGDSLKSSAPSKEFEIGPPVCNADYPTRGFSKTLPSRFRSLTFSAHSDESSIAYNEKRSILRRSLVEEGKLQKQVAELQKCCHDYAGKIQELEKQSAKWKTDFESASSNLESSKNLSARYRHKHQTSLEDLFRQRSDAQRTQQGLQTELEEMKLKLKQTRHELAETKKRKVRTSSFVRTYEPRMNWPEPLPNRPAFDKRSPSGIPAWASGLFLYESLIDHACELNIKQLLLRAILAAKRTGHNNALELVLQAGKHAYGLNNMPLLAKCSYYRGCSEHSLGYYQKAELSFIEALAAEDRYIEGTWAVERLNEMGKLRRHRHGIAEPLPYQPEQVMLLGRKVVRLPASRWFIDEDHKQPKIMDTYGRARLSAATLLKGFDDVSVLSEPGPAILEETQRRLDKENEDVLLRPESIPDDELKFYYNSILAKTEQWQLASYTGGNALDLGSTTSSDIRSSIPD